jgi:hypothetical protein
MGESSCGGSTHPPAGAIAQSDALIALLTRQKGLAGNNKVAAVAMGAVGNAQAKGKPAITLVAPGVDVGGLFAENEPIDLDPKELLDVLLQLSETVRLRKEHAGRYLLVRLLLDQAAAMGEHLMALKIAQSASPKSEARWNWSVWIEGSDAELGSVREVTWRLHPTFEQPVRLVDTRATNFRLDSVGWDEFMIYATLKMNNGRSKSLQHWLKLVEEDEPSGVSAPMSKTRSRGSKSERPSVFLSYSLNNASLAAHLARSAMSIFLLASKLRDWNIDQIGKSNAVVVLGADQSGIARSSEVQIAQSAGVPVIPVTLGSSLAKKADVSPMFGKIKPLHVAASNPAKIAPALATMIGKLPV